MRITSTEMSTFCWWTGYRRQLPVTSWCWRINFSITKMSGKIVVVGLLMFLFCGFSSGQSSNATSAVKPAAKSPDLGASSKTLAQIINVVDGLLISVSSQNPQKSIPKIEDLAVEENFTPSNIWIRKWTVSIRKDECFNEILSRHDCPHFYQFWSNHQPIRLERNRHQIWIDIFFFGSEQEHKITCWKLTRPASEHWVLSGTCTFIGCWWKPPLTRSSPRKTTTTMTTTTKRKRSGPLTPQPSTCQPFSTGIFHYSTGSAQSFHSSIGSFDKRNYCVYWLFLRWCWISDQLILINLYILISKFEGDQREKLSSEWRSLLLAILLPSEAVSRLVPAQFFVSLA